MTVGSDQAANDAWERDALLGDDPDERGRLLLDAAGQSHRAGDHDHAVELLTECIALGGEDGGNARVALADVLFDLDRTEDALAQLDALRNERPSSPVPCHLAAELLAERGAPQQALTWFNMAISRLGEQEMAQRHGEFGAYCYANGIIAGRRRVRRTLGLTADELDDSVREPDPSMFDRLLDHAIDLDNRVGHPKEARVLYWPRDEVVPAHQRWPQLVQHTDVDAIMREREDHNRGLAAAGTTRITMAPLTAARLAEFVTRTGGDPADERTRYACMTEIIRENAAISWPPGRNTPCWCGSEIKYKKCCGRPNQG